ncbi:MAG TPA: alpha/beta fold hydrolase [Cycloclasticus sp.]|jgi:pimeloyl-[acyl-carrier protein] methyl ester esterase|nr:alpha/beta fold hydrolase [Cycloclasticus sp.]
MGRCVIDLNVRVSGKGPNLVLIHGWAMGSAVWNDWLDELEERYQLIRIDLPGHGDSAHRQSWTMDELLDSMVAQLPASCYVLGWSLGGMVGLAYANKYAVRVQGLIMLASSAKFVRSIAWPHAQPEETLHAFSQGLLENPSATLKRFVMLQTQGLQSPRKISALLKKSMCTAEVGRLTALASGLKVLQYTDLREQLKALRCPLLMLLGDKDQLIPVSVGLDSVQYNNSTVLHIIKGASHVPFLSHATETTQHVCSFFQDKACI